MSKILKAVLVVSYVILFINYLKTSLTIEGEEIILDYRRYVPLRTHFRRVNKGYRIKKINLSFLEYKKPKRFSTDYKYILRHTNKFLHLDTSLCVPGQTSFIQNNCKFSNCYITSDINLLMDIRYYDAVLFAVEDGWDYNLNEREPYQKYIFVAPEAKHPVCDTVFNDYYNLTWTYRLDSDIKWTHFNILDKTGKVIGPNLNMTWINPMEPTPYDVKRKLGNKNKAAACFVSHCNTKKYGEDFTKGIERELRKFGLHVDVFGWCVNKSCPNDKFEECLMLLERDYYFYLAFESVFSKDYVTDQVLYPLNHYAVPIVYGGANYSRFLPPGSYIDVTELDPFEVAHTMYKAIKNPRIYEDYFRWHNHYEYRENRKTPDMCKLCQILNEETNKKSTYKNFLYWWNGDRISACYQKTGTITVDKVENVMTRNAIPYNTLDAVKFVTRHNL